LLDLCIVDVIGDAYMVASGILAPDEDGFWAEDTAHNASWGAGRIMALAIDIMRVALEVGLYHFLVPLALGCLSSGA